MSRKRTGTLVWRKGSWHAQVTATVAGKTKRLWYDVGTADRAVAEQRLSKLVADVNAGRVDIAEDRASAPGTVDELAEAHFKVRQARGVVSVDTERARYRDDIHPFIGHLAVEAVRAKDIAALIDAAIARGLSRESVVKIRGVAHRLFKQAWERETIEVNPVARAKVPKMREIKKVRVILEDHELDRMLACPEVHVEIKMLALVSRTLGGARTGDLNKWDWSMVDRVDFARAFIPRSKTAEPDELEVPELLRPFLKAWWQASEVPDHGPVFPVEIGKRAGEFKAARGNGYAARLRRALFTASVLRAEPVRVPRRGKGLRWDIPGKYQGETMLAPNPLDPLYHETAATLPVDFHSFRRAFNTGLAEAGVNVQTAMLLAGHADAKTHMRYVQQTRAMRRVPDAALPRLPATCGAVANSCESDPTTTKQGSPERRAETSDDAQSPTKQARSGEPRSSYKPDVAGSTPVPPTTRRFPHDTGDCPASAPSRYSTAMRTATPASTWLSTIDRSKSAMS